MANELVYMVTYRDDKKQKHISFVKGLAAVRFIKDRFGEIEWEVTDTYRRTAAE